MSLKKVEQVKKDKGFKIFDLIVYGAIVALVVILFIVVFATRDTDPLHGIRISVNNVAVFECNFDDGTYGALTEDGTVTFEEPAKGEKLIVTVNIGDGYNVVEIDLEARVVRVIDADCRRNDCMYTKLNPVQIRDNNSVIYCSPHAMSIEPLNFEYNFDNPDFKV